MNTLPRIVSTYRDGKRALSKFERKVQPMTRSKQTKINEVRSRKEAQNPHGPIKSLAELSDEYDREHGGSKSK